MSQATSCQEYTYTIIVYNSGKDIETVHGRSKPEDGFSKIVEGKQLKRRFRTRIY